jgi:carbonic anhydrase
MVLSCVDSRVPVEDVCDLGIGDIFIARVAGTIENASIAGSMEFANAVAGSKLITVLDIRLVVLRNMLLTIPMQLN